MGTTPKFKLALKELHVYYLLSTMYAHELAWDKTGIQQ